MDEAGSALTSATFGRMRIGAVESTGVRVPGEDQILFLKRAIPAGTEPIWQTVDPDDHVALSNPMDERVIKDVGLETHCI